MPLVGLPIFLEVVVYGDRNCVQIVFGLVLKFVFHFSRLNPRGPNPILYRQARFLFHQNDRPPSPCYVDPALFFLRDAHPSIPYLSSARLQATGFFAHHRKLKAPRQPVTSVLVLSMSSLFFLQHSNSRNYYTTHSQNPLLFQTKTPEHHCTLTSKGIIYLNSTLGSIVLVRFHPFFSLHRLIDIIQRFFCMLGCQHLLL